MSVKLMTTEQIHTNLATIANMWPGGIPTEQNDQVNALKAELKRRGVEQRAVQPATMQAAKPIGEMTAEQLSKELQKLSLAIGKDPNNEELQEQFANVRFELRNKLKAEPVPAPPVTGNFDPTTGETHMQQLAKPTNGTNGHETNLQSELEARRAAFDAHQQQQAVARARDMEVQLQLVRKHNLAKVSADVAATMLFGKEDPNGDDIEEACNLGIKVAETIYAKVGL